MNCMEKCTSVFRVEESEASVHDWQKSATPLN